MATKQPDEIAEAAVESGVAKAHLRWDKVLVGGFLAGAYIAFGGLVAISVSSGLDPKTWGTLPTLFMGVTFCLGLVLVVLAGSHLLTGNMMLVPIGAMRGRLTVGDVVRNLTLVTIGNVLGAMFVAYFLSIRTGVIGSAGAAPGSTAAMTFDRLTSIAGAKALREDTTQIFLRAVGCNWLVCLAVWIALAADSVGSKILGIFFPIMAFVAMGFDHVVANMFFLPAGIWAGVPGLTWGAVLHNWVFAFLGNLVGAVVFVAGAYWYMYLRPAPGSGTGQADIEGHGDRRDGGRPARRDTADSTR
jgi:formate/nitrite transporter